jgi:hypothetical protein
LLKQGQHVLIVLQAKQGFDLLFANFE